MTRQRTPAAVGTRISPHLTVLGHVDAEALDPVYIVWHHEAWCPMVCKAFRTRARAQREAAVLASLAHPNTPRFLGCEAHLLLMEYLEGRTLAHLLDAAPTKRMSISNALRVAIHVGAALQHVHATGYIHLDVKPSNIMIGPTGRPVLFDFGTARRINGPRPSAICGTNDYIAPEECERRRVDPAADVFSLGVVLFEMLTGRLPFGDGTRQRPFPQVSRNASDLRAFCKKAPPELQRILAQCLVRDERRRPSLEVLLPALHRHITSGPPMWPEGFEPGRCERKGTRMKLNDSQRVTAMESIM
jgi:serine/threonine protein kinase